MDLYDTLCNGEIIKVSVNKIMEKNWIAEQESEIIPLTKK